MSRTPDEILMALANRVVEYVRDLVGDRDLVTVFVSGGVARGEIAAARFGGHTEIYSDLDLYVVVGEDMDLEATRSHIKSFAAGLARRGDDFRIYPAPDVGVYTADALRHQAVRPGTVEIAAAHNVLYGNKDLTTLTGRFSERAIGATEGMYLLENRLTEIADVVDAAAGDDTAGYRRYVHYTLIKSCQDVLTAALCASGRFDVSRERRMEILKSASSESGTRDILDAAALAAIDASYHDLERLQSVIEITPAELETKRRHVEALLLSVWRRMTRRTLGGGDGWADVVERRCCVRRWLANARELLVLGKRMGISRAGLARHIDRLARYSPVEALRLTGLVDLVLRRGESGDLELDAADRRRLADGYVSALEELTRSFGVNRGPVFGRGRELFRRTT